MALLHRCDGIALFDQSHRQGIASPKDEMVLSMPAAS
jgi:hypothetical protein